VISRTAGDIAGGLVFETARTRSRHFAHARSLESIVIDE